jgi:hypothetical protein
MADAWLWHGSGVGVILEQMFSTGAPVAYSELAACFWATSSGRPIRRARSEYTGTLRLHVACCVV